MLMLQLRLVDLCLVPVAKRHQFHVFVLWDQYKDGDDECASLSNFIL